MLIRPRFYVPEIVLGIFLAIAIFAMGMLFGSGYHPAQTPANQQPAHQTAQHQPERTIWGWLTHDATGFFTLLLFVAVGVQAALFIWQLKLIADGTKDAKVAANAARDSADALTSAERPHLLIAELAAHVRIADVPNFEAQTIPVTYIFDIKNFGRSPAFMTGYVFQMHIGQLPPTPKYDPLWSDSNIIVPENSLHSTSDRRKIGDVRVDEAAAVRDGTTPVFVFGVVEYKSVFRRKHKLRFCYQLAFPGASFESSAFYPTGGDAYWEYS